MAILPMKMLSLKPSNPYSATKAAADLANSKYARKNSYIENI